MIGTVEIRPNKVVIRRTNLKDIIIITYTVICRADGSCEAGVPALIVAQDMLQVAQTQAFLISTLPQSLFLFNGVELNYHNIQGGI